MGKTIDVALYGAPEHTGFIAGALRRHGPPVNVLGVCAGTRDMERLCAEREHVVAVLCFVDEESEGTAQFIKHAGNRGVRATAVCATVQSGFALLKKGALAMTVMDENEKEQISDLALNSLVLKIKNVHASYFETVARVMKNSAPAPGCTGQKVVAIGSSTGGTETVKHIICELKPHMPPVLIVQHMPPVFTKLYAERLNNLSALTVWEARDGDELKPGLVLVAPGERQMRLVRKDGRLAVSCREEEKVSGHCPSVDVLFESVAEVAGQHAIGVILTGMGNDGARGLLAMKQKGGFTIGQDEESSVVYGMPRAAWNLGAVDVQADYRDMAKLIMGKI